MITPFRTMGLLAVASLSTWIGGASAWAQQGGVFTGASGKTIYKVSDVTPASASIGSANLRQKLAGAKPQAMQMVELGTNGDGVASQAFGSQVKRPFTTKAAYGWHPAGAPVFISPWRATGVA